MNKTDILSGFNNHLNEFFNDVVNIFPDNLDIKVAQTSLSTMRKANPRLIVAIWREHIVSKYEKETIQQLYQAKVPAKVLSTLNNLNLLDTIDISSLIEGYKIKEN